MEQDVEKVWQAYSEAWTDITVEDRLRLLSENVTEDVVLIAPDGVGHGREELLTRLADFQKTFPGASFQTKNFISHHNRSLADWNMVAKDGSVILTGYSVGHYNADGKLSEITGYWRQ